MRGFAAWILVFLTPWLVAGDIEKCVEFELGEWIVLDSNDGPVTLHRIRVVKQSGITKSKVFRPGNAEHLETIQIQLEFSNEATRDWEAHLDLEWVDAQGVTIDGYDDDENLDSNENHDMVTVTLSTLKYGLDRAEKFKIRIRTYPD